MSAVPGENFRVTPKQKGLKIVRETSAIEGDREAADYQLGTSASTGKAVVALIVVDRASGSDVEAEIPDKLRGRPGKRSLWRATR